MSEQGKCPAGDRRLEGGLRFMNTMAMRTKVQHLESMVDLYALIDLLVAKRGY